MKPLTDVQKKWMWAVGAVLLFVHFAPSMLASLREMSFPWDTHAPAVHSKPSPAHVAPVVAPAPPALDAEQLAQLQLTKLVGVWGGSTVQSERGSCRVRLELQTKPGEVGRYSGYSTRVCGSSIAFMAGLPTVGRMKESVLNQMTPVSDILSGTSANGSVTLNLDQAIAKSPDGCQLTGFTLTPFGQSQLAAKYTEDKCQGGQMVMVRAK